MKGDINKQQRRRYEMGSFIGSLCWLYTLTLNTPKQKEKNKNSLCMTKTLAQKISHMLTSAFTVQLLSLESMIYHSRTVFHIITPKQK